MGRDGQKLEENLKSLHTCMYTGSYRPQPSRRVYIPKSDGTKLPLGIASVEDKVLQHAVSETLSARYKVDFYGFLYGFRPGYSKGQSLPQRKDPNRFAEVCYQKYCLGVSACFGGHRDRAVGLPYV